MLGQQKQKKTQKFKVILSMKDGRKEGKTDGKYTGNERMPNLMSLSIPDLFLILSATSTLTLFVLLLTWALILSLW